MKIIKQNNISRVPPHIQPLHNIANTQTCPRCGSTLKEQSRIDQRSLVDTVANNKSTDKPRQVVFARYLLLTILAIVIGVFALSWRDGSGEVSEPQDQLTAEQSIEAPQQPSPTQQPSTPQQPSPPQNPPQPTSREDTVLNLEDDILLRQVVPTELLVEFSSALGPFRLAYLSRDGITVVNPTAITTGIIRQYRPVPASMLDLFAGFESSAMFVSGSGTFGFELSEDSEFLTVYRFSSQGHVIVGNDNSIAMAATSIGDSTAIYVGNPSGVFLRRLDVPAGARLLEVPSLGILMSSATGETFIANHYGFREFSDWPVWAATSTHHLEVRCPTSLECTPVLVDRVNVSEATLPIELVNEISKVTISPNGEFLFLTKVNQDGRGSNLLYKVDSNEFIEVNVAANDLVAWAPDSSSVIWFDRFTERPLVWILNTASNEVASFDLTRLNAPSRKGDSLLLLPCCIYNMAEVQSNSR